MCGECFKWNMAAPYFLLFLHCPWYSLHPVISCTRATLSLFWLKPTVAIIYWENHSLDVVNEFCFLILFADIEETHLTTSGSGNESHFSFLFAGVVKKHVCRIFSPAGEFPILFLDSYLIVSNRFYHSIWRTWHNLMHVLVHLTHFWCMWWCIWCIWCMLTHYLLDTSR
jgi:hypothetical protein